jgi:hypothetical protein
MDDSLRMVTDHSAAVEVWGSHAWLRLARSGFAAALE